MLNIELETKQVIVYTGDFRDRIDRLAAQVRAAAESEQNPQRGGGKSEAAQLKAEHNALVEEAKEKALVFTLRALRRDEWQKLVNAHPPRQGNEDDAAVGINEDTFKEALLPASIVEPEGVTADDLMGLKAGDYDRLYITAFGLNRMAGSDPKAFPDSPSSLENAATSS